MTSNPSNSVKEFMLPIRSVESLDTLALKTQSSGFYILIDMREISVIKMTVSSILKSTEKLFDFCKSETEEKRLLAVALIVKNDAIRKVMSNIISMKSFCPTIVCLNLDEGREFAKDTAYLANKQATIGARS